MSKKRNFETDAIRSQKDRTAFREHSVPLYLTSSFVFDDAEQARAMFADEIPGNIYSRYSNPNTDELVEKLCQLHHSINTKRYTSTTPITIILPPQEATNSQHGSSKR